MSYSTTILADSPVGYWRLGELSGTAAIDLGSGGTNGVYTPNSSGAWIGGTLGVSGAVAGGDTAATFNGSSGYVAIASAFSITDYPVTWEAWVKTTDTSGGLFAACGLYNSGSTSIMRGIGMASSVPCIWNSNANRNLGTTNITDGVWHHLVAVLAASNLRKLFVNGAQEGGDFTDDLFAFPTVTRAAIGRNDDSSPGQYWPGDIDEVAIYAAALTSTQIAAHYAARLASGTLPPLSMAYHLAGIR